MVLRREFLLGTASVVALAGAGVTLSSRKSNAAFFEALGIIAAGLQLYQAMQSPITSPDLKLQLILEASHKIDLLHKRINGIENAIFAIMEKIESLSEENREIIRGELDLNTSDALLSACTNIYLEVKKLRADFESVPVAEIPESQLFSLRSHLAELQQMRTQLFNRSDLSSMALCTAAITEISIEKFLGSSRDRIRPVVLYYIDEFVKMEDLDNPISLYSIHDQVSRLHPPINGDSKNSFTSGLLFPEIFSDWDLRNRSASSKNKPFSNERDSSLEISRYVQTTIFSKITDFVKFEKGGHYSGVGSMLYHFPDRENSKDVFTSGIKIPYGRLANVGGPGPVSTPYTNWRIPREGLDKHRYIANVENYCADIKLKVQTDPYIEGLQYTEVAEIEVSAKSYANEVKSKRLLYTDWLDAGAIVIHEPTEPANPFAAAFELNGSYVEDCGDEKPRLAVLGNPKADGNQVYPIDISERDNHIDGIKEELEKAKDLYNARVSYLMTLSSFKSLVLATIDELGRRYREWDA